MSSVVLPPGVGVMAEPMAGVEPASGSTGDTSDREPVVIVPRGPGPILRPRSPSRPEDELDELIDEMFGQTTDEQPGRLDVVLLVGGVVIAIWGVITASLGVVLLAGLLILLGAALPARSALRAYHRRRLAAERRRAAAEGHPLDVSDPSVAALVDAYEQLCSIAERSTSDLAQPSVLAAHLAVAEAAVMLEGRPPVGEADRRYVEVRTAAITEVALGLATSPRHDDRLQPRGQDASVAARSAKVAVREALEASTDLGAVGRLRRLETRLEREHGDDRPVAPDQAPAREAEVAGREPEA